MDSLLVYELIVNDQQIDTIAQTKSALDINIFSRHFYR